MEHKTLTGRGNIFKVILFILLGLAIYSNTFHASFHLDDGNNIVTNFAIRNPWNLKAVWNFLPTRFFTYLSLAGNYQLHQLSLPGYHLFNLAVHLGTALLVSWFALLLLSTPALKDSPITRHAKLISLLSGLIFLSHPIQTQAVTYIIQRAASLATFFYLLSVCCYLKARLSQIKKQSSPDDFYIRNVIPADCSGAIHRTYCSKRVSRNFRIGFPTKTFGNDSVLDSRSKHSGMTDVTYVKVNSWWKYYAGSILFAVVALFTKETAVTLPFMLLLCEVSFFRDSPKYQATPSPSPLPFGERIKVRGEIKRLAPFFVILLVFLIVFRLTGPDRISEVRILKETQSGLTAITPAQYLLTQFRVIVTYLRLLFFPVNQNLDYDYPIAQTLGQAPVLTSFIFMMLILAAAVMLFRKYRLLSFSIFWFFLALVPESSVLPIRDVIFEHRLYLPMVGFCLFLPVVLYYLSGDKRWKPAVILMLVIIAGYSIMTYNRNRVWKDEITLWTDVVKKSPNKARPYSNRGMAYSLQGEYEKAIADCGRAVQLSPNYAAAYCNRASAYYFSGNYNLAIVDYTRAIELQPTLSDAYFNRGFAYQKKKEYDRAIFDWSRVVELKPRDQDAYFNRAWMYVEKGEYDRAIADCSQVIRETPRFAGAYFMRANAYRHKGLYADALVDYTQALKINPAYGEAYNNRALLFVSLGEYQLARGDIRKMEELGFPFNPALRKLLPEPDN